MTKKFINSEKVKSFAEECRLVNVEAVMGTEKHHFPATVVLMDSYKNHQ